MDKQQIDTIVHAVVARDMGPKAARRARVERVEMANIVQLWERGGTRRYTAVVDGPEPLASALSESREPFGAAPEGDYREDRLARLPAGLRSRVEKVLAGWGPSTEADVAHAVEPVAIVRAGGRGVVVTLGARPMLCRSQRDPVFPGWLMFVPMFLFLQFRIIACLGPSHSRDNEVFWLSLLALSTLCLVGGLVAVKIRARATERIGPDGD